MKITVKIVDEHTGQSLIDPFAPKAKAVSVWLKVLIGLELAALAMATLSLAPNLAQADPDQTAVLTIVKNVDNTAGGSAVPGDFTMQLLANTGVPGSSIISQSFPGDSNGTAVTIDFGNGSGTFLGHFIVSESNGPANYTPSFSGACDNSGKGSFQPNNNLTCTVTNTYTPPGNPSGGGDSGQSSGGGPSGNSSTTTTTLFTLTVVKSGDGDGTVTSGDQIINCGLACSQPYASGSNISLMAAPNATSTFDDTWVTGPCSGSTSTVCAFTIVNDEIVTAHFKQVVFTSGGGGGGGSSGSSGGSSGSSGSGGSGGGGSGGGSGPSSGSTGSPQAGSGSSSGGGGSVSPAAGGGSGPQGQVLGASTFAGLQMPTDPAIGNGSGQPEVLGASTGLPRTGLPAAELWFLILTSLILALARFKIFAR